MDVSNRQLALLLDKTDSTFKLLRDNPSSVEYSNAYEEAKQELDCYLDNIRDSLKKKYKDF
ncbi:MULTISPECIES: hypothetical protein [Alteromonadaceae]|uniref:hypothetical protein n=1 Tax=Alteromonadaceae TaxID=72275 RepID=UPI001C081461|nr:MULTISPECIES: hypothetical protein [Aliiglaciecola]MBU2879415.1 hypothetical protein [Aliiglaciecola lipolytica]MDO6712457.1 hypothetical protein [Aliiglaciecola sp. 2_MG-2023]MDO6753485.1 hypothetical protein [Aliiglaciecola sp. 1_MG-2023]